MVNATEVAEVVAGLGVAGIPTLLVLLAGGGLIFGIVWFSAIGFLSQWFIPLVFLATGIIALIEFAPRGGYYPLVGLAALIGSVVLGFAIYNGAFNGPAYTWSLLSLQSGGPSIAAGIPAALALMILSVIVGLANIGLGIFRLIQIEE